MIGKHQALVSLPTGEDISGSALTSALGATGQNLIPVNTIASFHTGVAAVAHFFMRVKSWFRPPPQILILPAAMSMEQYSQMVTDMVGAEPHSKSRELMAGLRDGCLGLARVTEDAVAADGYLSIAIRAKAALSPQYLPDHIIERAYHSLMAEYDFVDSLL